MLFLALIACSGSDPTPAASSDAAPAPAVEDPSTEPPRLDKAALTGAARQATLVPSPTEMQRALSENGIDRGLSKLVPAHTAAKDGDNQDVVAVRVGMDLAYTLLTLKDAETAAIVERLGQVKTGMTTLGAGDDMAAVIDDVVGRLQSDALSRDDLLSELDEMHGAVLPEIEFEAGERVVPLIQAGSWLAGVNLVSTAIVQAKNERAAQLLAQPEVAEHFLSYVRTEGAGKAPPAVMQQLEQTLTELSALAKQDELSLEDVGRVREQTGKVLALL